MNYENNKTQMISVIIVMSDEYQKKPEIPHRMSRIAFPKAKYGVYIAIIIIVVVLFLFYKDSIL